MTNPPTGQLFKAEGDGPLFPAHHVHHHLLHAVWLRLHGSRGS